MSVAILSMPNGIDFSEFIPLYKHNGTPQCDSVAISLSQSHEDLSPKPMKLMHMDSNLNLDGIESSNSNSYTIPQTGKIK